MDCAEIRSGFVGGSIPEGPAVAEHVALCPQCRELFEKGAELGRRLARAVLPPVPPEELLLAVEQDLAGEQGIHASLRALPTWLRTALLVGLGLLLVGSHLLLDRRSDFGDYGAVAFWGIALAFGGALLLGSWRLLRGASQPLAAARRERRVALLLLALPILAALLAPLGAPPTPLGILREAETWGSVSSCFNYGVALVMPFALLAWLLERRDRVPLSALVAAGALAGIAANLLLHAHCSSVHLGHLLLGHASIGAAWALGLALLSRGFQRAR